MIDEKKLIFKFCDKLLNFNLLSLYSYVNLCHYYSLIYFIKYHLIRGVKISE
jgi:hypothetical protein